MRAGGDCGVRGPGEAAARAAGDNRGRRSRVCDRPPSGTGWDDSEGRERARYGRRKRKDGNDEWDRVLEIGCSGQRKDFRELGFMF